MPPTPPLTPSPSPTKRKRGMQVTTQRIEVSSTDEISVIVKKSVEVFQANDDLALGGATSLADRVKKRRRGIVEKT